MGWARTAYVRTFLVVDVRRVDGRARLWKNRRMEEKLPMKIEVEAGGKVDGRVVEESGREMAIG